MTDIKTRGTPMYAAAGAALLDRTSDFWAMPSLNGASAGIYATNVTYADDDKAALVARLFGIPDAVTHSGGSDGYVVLVRSGEVEGIAFTITTVMPTPDGEVAP